MPEIAVATIDSAGGLIQTGASTVFVSGKPVATQGSQIATHSGHSGAIINSGSSSVFIEGKAIARKGDTASCGHSVTSGNSKIFSG